MLIKNQFHILNSALLRFLIFDSLCTVIFPANRIPFKIVSIFIASFSFKPEQLLNLIIYNFFFSADIITNNPLLYFKAEGINYFL